MNKIINGFSAIFLAANLGAALPAEAKVEGQFIEPEASQEKDDGIAFDWGILPVVSGSIDVDGEVTPAVGLAAYGEVFYGKQVPGINKLVDDISFSASVVQTINTDDKLTNNFTAFSHRVLITDRIEAKYTHGTARFGAGVKGKFEEAMAKVCVIGKCNDDVNVYAVAYNHSSSYEYKGQDMITTEPTGFMWGVGVKYDTINLELLHANYNEITPNNETGGFDVNKTSGVAAGLGTAVLNIRVPLG
mgnify:CR=1 FL=1|tara:strand:- start:112080 stop:112817 length:738 start_codon:yes stop_codon:yes gene_type:complete